VLCSVALTGLLASTAMADATTLRGTILAIEASGQVVVNDGATAGVPTMTMTYRIAPAPLFKTLHVGDHIVATLDSTTSPETLRNARVVSSAPLVNAPSPIRTVEVLRVGDKVPQIPLVDQTGTPFTFTKYFGRDVVLAFIYTRCRDPRECPLTSAKFGELQSRLRSRNAHLVEVTLDPAYDTPKVLARYAGIYNADPAKWTFATGRPNDVLNFDAAFGLDPFVDPRFGLIHGETLAVVDPRGTIHDLVYTNSWQPSEIVASLDEVDHVASNPLARLDLWLSQAAVAVCGNGVAGFDGFGDLLVVLAIFAAFGYIFWRVFRAIMSNARES